MTKKDKDQIVTQDTGNGNPPPKKPPETTEPTPDGFTTLSDTEGEADTGNGNPPPKG